MPIQISFEIDGGLTEYKKILENELDGIKNFKPLFEIIIKYFEGKENGLFKFDAKSPILKIYETNGSVIGGNWNIRDVLYSEWKKKNWSDAREYDVGLNENHLQILTGATLHSLLFGDDPNAVRNVSETSMEYGTKVDYAGKNQDSHHILDFHPRMIEDINHIIALYINQLGTLESNVGMALQNM